MPPDPIRLRSIGAAWVKRARETRRGPPRFVPRGVRHRPPQARCCVPAIRIASETFARQSTRRCSKPCRLGSRARAIEPKAEAAPDERAEPGRQRADQGRVGHEHRHTAVDAEGSQPQPRDGDGHVAPGHFRCEVGQERVARQRRERLAGTEQTEPEHNQEAGDQLFAESSPEVARDADKPAASRCRAPTRQSEGSRAGSTDVGVIDGHLARGLSWPTHIPVRATAGQSRPP